MKKLKIIFVGVPDMAIVCLDKLLKEKFNIIGVIPPRKSHITYNMFKSYVENKKLNMIEFDNSPNDKEYIEKIKALNADIGVVCAYDVKFSKEFLSTTKMGYLNCHPSLLPEYRGAMPYFHIIKDGCETSGVTVHFMDEKFDMGDIVSQMKFEISPYETMGTLFNKTNFMLSDMLCEVLLNIEKEIPLKRIPQNKELNYKTAPNILGNFKIKWDADVVKIQNLIKACNPFYRAYTYFRNTYVRIISAYAIEYKHDFEYGKIVEANEKEILIAAKNGYLSLEIAEVGTWGTFGIKEFYYTFLPNKEEFFK